MNFALAPLLRKAGRSCGKRQIIYPLAMASISLSACSEAKNIEMATSIRIEDELRTVTSSFSYDCEVPDKNSSKHSNFIPKTDFETVKIVGGDGQVLMVGSVYPGFPDLCRSNSRNGLTPSMMWLSNQKAFQQLDIINRSIQKRLREGELGEKFGFEVSEASGSTNAKNSDARLSYIDEPISDILDGISQDNKLVKLGYRYGYIDSRNSTLTKKLRGLAERSEGEVAYIPLCKIFEEFSTRYPLTFDELNVKMDRQSGIQHGCKQTSQAAGGDEFLQIRLSRTEGAFRKGKAIWKIAASRQNATSYFRLGYDYEKDEGFSDIAKAIGGGSVYVEFFGKGQATYSIRLGPKYAIFVETENTLIIPEFEDVSLVR